MQRPHVIQHGAPVSMALSVVYECPDVDALRRVPYSRAYSYRDVVLVWMWSAAVQRLVNVKGERAAVAQSQLDPFANRPGTPDATYYTVYYGLYVATEAP